jgi:protein-S-isoprenylcysteine O-methyltransferase Ste14
MESSPMSSEKHIRDSLEPGSQTRERSNTQDAANLGLVRPPLVYLVAMLVGVGLDLIRPLHWLPLGVAAWVGVPIVITSLVLFVASTHQFKKAGTPIPGNEPTTAIVQAGPYRFSRNPIYLAFSVLVLGIACWLNSIWLLGTLAAAVLLMSTIVIPREERYLAQRFNSEYLEYKAKVRRWL